jgi:hypothetical protein
MPRVGLCPDRWAGIGPFSWLSFSWFSVAFERCATLAISSGRHSQELAPACDPCGKFFLLR